MKLKYVLFAVIFVFLCVAAAFFGSRNNDFEEEVDSLLDKVVRQKHFSGSMLVMQKDNVLLSKGYGVANPEYGIANDPDTVFRLGSMTKQFTAMAIMILKEEGALSLDDSLEKYIPQMKSASGVKIINLLSHTSGIICYTGFDDFQKIKKLPHNKDELIGKIAPHQLLFAPGEKTAYSNSNYLLLARIIEKVSGEEYETFMEKRILTKIGLDHTGFDSYQKIIPHRASGMTFFHEEPAFADYADMTVASGAGEMYSTVADLAKWYQAVRDNKLITKESTKEMLTPFIKDYALGWFVSQTDFGEMIHHGGSIEGFRSRIAFYPESDSLIVILSNTEAAATRDILDKISKILFHKSYEPFEYYDEIPLEPSKGEALSGKYELQPGVNLTITYNQNKLSGQFPGEEPFTLLRAKENLFFMKVTDAKVEFVCENGRAKIVHFSQGGQSFEGRRID